MRNVLAASGTRLKYPGVDDFHAELRRRVDEYFAVTGRKPRDCRPMYLKSGILIASFAVVYSLLVFVSGTWWLSLPLAVFLGLASAGIGLNVQHDGIHRAYSDRPWVNRLAAMSLDLLGGSSYIYHARHTIFHHTFTNVDGHDTDIELGPFGRMAPSQKRRAIHRWQHYYLWLIYGLMVINWHLISDFRDVIMGKICRHPYPRPQGSALATFIGGKIVFATIAFIVPALFHPLWVVLVFYAVVAILMGITLAIVFQLAHCVEEAEFPLPDAESGRIEKPWAIQQVETTVDFARDSKLVAWLLGGLNFQIEHHLFPRVCHVHYPDLAKIVERTCREHGVRYAAHPSVGAGLVSHFRWLRRMASGEAAA